MTVGANDRKTAPVTATGGETLISYDFPVSSAADLAVVRRRGGADLTLSLNTDYTVDLPNSQVVLVTAAVADDEYIIKGATPQSRNSDLSYSKALVPSLLNGEFDNLQKQIQENASEIGRTLRRSEFDTGAPLELPPAVADQVIGFDDDLNLTLFARGDGGGSGSIPDPLTIEKGGTGANSAAAALTALGGVTAAQVNTQIDTKTATLGLGDLATRDDVATAQIADDAVTIAKLADGVPGRYLGYDDAGVPEYKQPVTATEITALGRHASGAGGATRSWIVDDQDLFVAGDGTSGQNGMAADTSVPVRVAFSPPPVAPLGGLVSGAGSTFLIDANGHVWALGNNNKGQLGLGDTENRHVATRIEYFVSEGVAIAEVYPTPHTGGTANYTFFRSTTGDVYACGDNASGQLGVGDTTDRTTPVPVPALTEVIAGIALSGNDDPHTLAWEDDGQLWAAGYNGQGQLGDGTTTARSTFFEVSGMTAVAQAAAYTSAATPGFGTSMVLRPDGSVAMCGDNGYGQLGQGDTTDRSSFTDVSLSGELGAQIALVGMTAGVRTTGGNVWLWGRNASGQLGDGASSTDSDTPAKPAGDFQTTATDLQMAGDFTVLTVYIKTAASIWAAGDGTKGATGTGSIAVDNQTFAEVVGLSGAVTDMQAQGDGNTDFGLTVLYENGRAGVCGSNADGELALGSVGAHAFAVVEAHLINRTGPRGLDGELSSAGYTAAAQAVAAAASTAADAIATAADRTAAANSAGEALADAGEAAASATAAAASATSAANSATSASGYATTALAAANATGDRTIYGTKAEATAALGSHAEGDIVEVLVDESLSNAHALYRVESAALVFKVNLDQMVAAGITDSTATGRALVTAADATEARDTIGVADVLPQSRSAAMLAARASGDGRIADVGLHRIDADTYHVYTHLLGTVWRKFQMLRGSAGLPLQCRVESFERVQGYITALDARWTYSGTWTDLLSADPANNVGGLVKWADGAGEYAEVTGFFGGDLYVDVVRRTSGGRLKVTIDGSTAFVVLPRDAAGVPFIETYSASDLQYRTPNKITSGLPDGLHTIRLEVMATADAASSGTRCYLDCVRYPARPWDEYSEAPLWAEGITVVDRERRRASNGELYYANGAGTTGATEPTHTSGSASDGAVTWVRMAVSPWERRDHFFHLNGSQMEYAFFFRPTGQTTFEDFGGTTHGNEEQLTEAFVVGAEAVTLSDGAWAIGSAVDIAQTTKGTHSEAGGGATEVISVQSCHHFSAWPGLRFQARFRFNLACEFTAAYTAMWPLQHWSAANRWQYGVRSVHLPSAGTYAPEDYYGEADANTPTTRDLTMFGVGDCLPEDGVAGVPDAGPPLLSFIATLATDPLSVNSYAANSGDAAFCDLNTSAVDPGSNPNTSMTVKFYMARLDGTTGAPDTATADEVWDIDNEYRIDLRSFVDMQT